MDGIKCAGTVGNIATVDMDLDMEWLPTIHNGDPYEDIDTLQRMMHEEGSREIEIQQ